MEINKEKIVEICKTVEDPELFIDIWTLGLIYDIKIDAGKVDILMTFTSPMCPFGPEMVEDLKTKLAKEGIENVKVEVTFEPAWKPSEELREMMGV